MDVKEFYNQINGNYNYALQLMMNDMLIARMIGKFIANNTYEEIISSYDKKDYRSLFTAVHAFKGVSGNLALTPLYDLSCKITEATRNNDNANIDNEIDELKQLYEAVKNNYLKYIAS